MYGHCQLSGSSAWSSQEERFDIFKLASLLLHLYLSAANIINTHGGSPQGVLRPGICYTRSNFFVKGGEVTTLTITGDLFSPCDVNNILIELIMNYLGYPVHCLPTACLSSCVTLLWTLPTIDLACWSTKPILSPNRQSLHTGYMKLFSANEINTWTTCNINKRHTWSLQPTPAQETILSTQSGSLQCSAAHPPPNSEIPWSCKTCTWTFLFGWELRLSPLGKGAQFTAAAEGRGSWVTGGGNGLKLLVWWCVDAGLEVVRDEEGSRQVLVAVKGWAVVSSGESSSWLKASSPSPSVISNTSVGVLWLFFQLIINIFSIE